MLAIICICTDKGEKYKACPVVASQVVVIKNPYRKCPRLKTYVYKVVKVSKFGLWVSLDGWTL